MAMQVEPEAEPGPQGLRANDVVPELVAQIRKAKALDWLLHHVEIVDPDGNPLDRDLVLGHTHDDARRPRPRSRPRPRRSRRHDHDHDVTTTTTRARSP